MKKLVEWHDDGTTYFSAVFSWQIPEINRRAENPQFHEKRFVAGGPAVVFAGHKLNENVEKSDEKLPYILEKHNPDATRTSRGCPKCCPYCCVPQIHGHIQELKNWPVRSIIIDDNILAASENHFQKAIDRLKALPMVDFNQGLDASLLTNFHARALGKLSKYARTVIRFAWDRPDDELEVETAMRMCLNAGCRKKDMGCYCLINYEDSPDEALYRLSTIAHRWRISPFPMRYQPLNSWQKDTYVGPKWSEELLQKYMRYWSNLSKVGSMPFEQFSSYAR